MFPNKRNNPPQRGAMQFRSHDLAVSVISDPSGNAVGRLTRCSCLALTPLAGGWQIHSKLAQKGCQTKIQVILAMVYRAARGRATGRLGNGMKEIITAETKVNAPT